MSNKPESVGAVWIRKSKKGEAYFSIKLNDEFFVAFKNKYKQALNQPDFRIFKQEDPKPQIPDEDIPF